MALDVGDVRIGVAVSDLMGIIANPLETYTRKGDVAKDAIYIANLAKQHEVDLFVSGLAFGAQRQGKRADAKNTCFHRGIAEAHGNSRAFHGRAFHHVKCRKGTNRG